MRIGYARVSSPHQNLARQLTALKEAGCDLVFSEKQSGKALRNRPELARAIARLKPDDVFVVAEWDRATRSAVDGHKLIHLIHKKGATLKVLDRQSLDLTTPIGRAVLGLLSAIYEEDRERIVRRAREGIDEAKRRKVRFGPKPKLSAEQCTMARRMVEDGISYRKTAAALGVTHRTISKLFKLD